MHLLKPNVCCMFKLHYVGGSGFCRNHALLVDLVVPRLEASMTLGEGLALRAYCAHRGWDTHPSNTVGGDCIISSESISEK